MYTDVFTKGASSDACVPTGKLLGINAYYAKPRAAIGSRNLYYPEKYLSLPYPENDYDMHRKAQIFW